MIKYINEAPRELKARGELDECLIRGDTFQALQSLICRENDLSQTFGIPHRLKSVLAPKLYP